MSDVVNVDTSGTWRNYRFVVWTDVFVPALASLVFLALLVVGFAVATPFVARSGMSQAEFGRLIPTLFKRPITVQALTAASDLVLLFFLWRIARRVADASLVARYRRTGRAVLLAALAGGIAMAFVTMIALAQLASRSLVKFHTAPGEQLFAPGNAIQYPVVILTVALIAPFVEEFYFRGVLLSWLGRKITMVPAALASALIFGLEHLRFVSHPGVEGWLLTGIVALVGLVNAVFAVRTASLWPCFVFHAAYNSSLLAAALLPRLLA